MKTILNNSVLIYNDDNYQHAVNYSQSLYNFPITLNYGEKHNRVKYILSCGTSDNITILQDGIFLYVLIENYGLSYIALDLINTEQKTVESVFLNEQDCTFEKNFSFDILNKDIKEQINILCEYL